MTVHDHDTRHSHKGLAIWWLITLDVSSVMTAFGQNLCFDVLAVFGQMCSCMWLGVFFCTVVVVCGLFLGVFNFFWACPTFFGLPPSPEPMFPALLQDRPSPDPPSAGPHKMSLSFSVETMVLRQCRMPISQVPLKSRVELLVPRIPNSSGIHSATRVVPHSANPGHGCREAGTTVSCRLHDLNVAVQTTDQREVVPSGLPLHHGTHSLSGRDETKEGPLAGRGKRGGRERFPLEGQKCLGEREEVGWTFENNQKILRTLASHPSKQRRPAPNAQHTHAPRRRDETFNSGSTSCRTSTDPLVSARCHCAHARMFAVFRLSCCPAASVVSVLSNRDLFRTCSLFQ